MWFLDWIIQRLNDASSFFYNLYIECYYAYYIPDIVATIFYDLSVLFANLSWDFYYFNQWAEQKEAQVAQILNWETIQSYITGWLRQLPNPLIWFINLWNEVWDEIDEWWVSTKPTVQGWIDNAKQDVLTFVNTLNILLTNLQTAWDDFKGKIPTIDELILWWYNWTGNVLSVVNSWWASALIEVQGLIDSGFTLREDFWRGWQDIRDKVIEFFTDPEDWLYKAVDRIIERFW